MAWKRRGGEGGFPGDVCGLTEKRMNARVLSVTCNSADRGGESGVAG